MIDMLLKLFFQKETAVTQYKTSVSVKTKYDVKEIERKLYMNDESLDLDGIFKDVNNLKTAERAVAVNARNANGCDKEKVNARVRRAWRISDGLRP